ncbi:MAG: hypothetical protein ACREC5_00660 [Thermoplasmata archaeon]
MSGSSNFVQVPGAVQYTRKYTLWVLILLVIVCWPVAILYYFTRDKVAVQELQTYIAPANAPAQVWSAQQPIPSGMALKNCPACGSTGQRPGGFCSSCGQAVPP